MAATLALQLHESQSAVPLQTEASTVVSQLIAEEVIFTMIMIIVISISASNVANEA